MENNILKTGVANFPKDIKVYSKARSIIAFFVYKCICRKMSVFEEFLFPYKKVIITKTIRRNNENENE